MQDTDILEKAKRGDREAITALLKTHGATARRAIAGRIPNKWQAVLSEDDVMQQAYADAVSRLGQLVAETEAGFAAWLGSIARRRLQDAIKGLTAEKRGGDRRQINNTITDQSFVNLVDLLSSGSSSPSGRAGRLEAVEALKAAIAELPETYRQVVSLYDLEGQSATQVSDTMNRSQGAVFMLRARAHERLHEILGRTSAYFSRSS